MAYQEVTHTGWFSRIGKSFGGMVTGLVLIVAATGLLYWNEGRTVKTGGAIGEAQMQTVQMGDISKVDPSFNGKVIYATGRADTKDMLQDPVFGVGKVAVKLDRDVEYYQWVESSRSEKRKKLGGGEETVTTYTYAKQWTSTPVDSNTFKDPDYIGINEVLARVQNEQWVAPTVSFGAYTLPDFLKSGIGGAQPLQVELEDQQKQEIAKLISVSRRYLRQPGAVRPGAIGVVADTVARSVSGAVLGENDVDVATYVHSQGNVVYIGADPNSPHVGDVRLTFTQTPPADVSIVAKVVGSTFDKFTASNGYTFSRIDMGTVSAETMFEGAKTENTVMAWILRVVGTFLVIAGLRMILAPLSVIADVVPIFGTIVGAGAGIVAFLLGLAWSLVVIAIAWIRFRPLLAAGLLAVVAALLALLYKRGRARKKLEGTGVA
ncbi:MAG TPA: primosome assembly protein PriA [Synergistaceae bacterium]|jgi:hypothetical protein|nr:primosome assembly protein PriA [Synergistaceae bacterium]